MNKFKDKVDEATYKFFIVPIIFLIGLYTVSIIIQSLTGINDFFRWVIFSGGIAAAIIYYFKKNLLEVDW